MNPFDEALFYADIFQHAARDFEKEWDALKMKSLCVVEKELKKNSGVLGMKRIFAILMWKSAV